jgi:hypothetical protein
MSLRLDDLPWRSIGGLGLVIALAITSALLPPGLGLACVLLAATLAIRILLKLGNSRGLTDYRQ